MAFESQFPRSERVGLSSSSSLFTIYTGAIRQNQRTSSGGLSRGKGKIVGEDTGNKRRLLAVRGVWLSSVTGNGAERRRSVSGKARATLPIEGKAVSPRSYSNTQSVFRAQRGKRDRKRENAGAVAESAKLP